MLAARAGGITRSEASVSYELDAYTTPALVIAPRSKHVLTRDTPAVAKARRVPYAPEEFRS
jgi:hypothetical protein